MAAITDARPGDVMAEVAAVGEALAQVVSSESPTTCWSGRGRACARPGVAGV